jgi:carboxylesterase type B
LELFGSIFVPKSIQSMMMAKLPVFFWIHGGSYMDGASTNAGLDGSNLANNGNMIVVTTNYRLGILGFLGYSQVNGLGGNWGLKDLVVALSEFALYSMNELPLLIQSSKDFINQIIPSFGGDVSRITIAGQSSGASLVKTLLTVPTAQSLFSQAIIHSSPMDVSDDTPSTGDVVGQATLSSLGCSDLNCLRGMSVTDILSSQASLYNDDGNWETPSIFSSEPWLPIVDGSFVKMDFIKMMNIPHGLGKDKPMIWTTVENEGKFRNLM